MANTDTVNEGYPNSGVRTLHSAMVTAENQFTTPALLAGQYNLAIYGTLAASTVVAQRSFDGGTTWTDVPGLSWTAAEQGIIDEPTEAGLYWRVGVKTGGYGGVDSINIRVWR